jgi:DNA polymerase III delta prime subunit
MFFCTNEPDKLVDKKNPENGQPFLDRLTTQVHVKTLSDAEMYDIMVNVAEFEGSPYTQEVLNYIVEYSKGVPRRALKCLGNVIANGSWDLDTVRFLVSDIIVSEDDPQIIELSRLLLKRDFKASCDLFARLVKKYPVESIRVAVCGFFVGCLKKSPNTNLSNAISQLTTPIYLTGKPAEHIFYNIIFKVIAYLGK